MSNPWLLGLALVGLAANSCDRRASDQERVRELAQQLGAVVLSAPLDNPKDVAPAKNKLSYCHAAAVAEVHRRPCVDQAFELADFFMHRYHLEVDGVRINQAEAGCEDAIWALEIPGARQDARWKASVAELRKLCCEAPEEPHHMSCPKVGRLERGEPTRR